MPRRLTDRQGDVLRLLCEGMSVDAIGERLRLAPRTVRALLVQIRLRLGETEAADLCALGAEDVAAAVDRAQRRQAGP